MKCAKLNEMIKGWFIGNFFPVAHKTEACEVAVKRYNAGDKEDIHFHKRATEITVIISGCIRMLEREWRDGEIVIIEPGEATDFEAITDSLTVVVKTPGVLNDKFFGESIAAE